MKCAYARETIHACRQSSGADARRFSGENFISLPRPALPYCAAGYATFRRTSGEAQIGGGTYSAASVCAMGARRGGRFGSLTADRAFD